MSKLIVSIIIYLCLLVSVSFAEVKQVGAIFDSQLGARALGMGKAQTALENQSYSLYSNPAGLRYLRYLEFNAERDSRMGELSTQVLGVGGKVKNIGFGLGYRHAGVSDIFETTVDGDDTGRRFSYSGQSILVGIGISPKDFFNVLPNFVKSSAICFSVFF